MTVAPYRPAAAARRQLLLDRFTELLEQAGARYPEDTARRLRDVVDDLGFALPAGIADPPPPARSTAEGRAAAKAHLAKALADRHPSRERNPA